MRKDAGIELAELKVDGGASVNDRLMQFQADMLGVRVRRPVVAETTALGAAYLAGLAVGYWPTRPRSPAIGPSIASFSPPCRPPSASGSTPAGRRPSSARKGWAKDAD